MEETRWWEYVQRIAAGGTNTEIADRAGIDRSHVSRWKSGDNPSVPFVVKFARAYGRPPVEAFVAMGWITDDEADVRERRVGLESLSTAELLAEVLRRVQDARLS